MDCRRTVLAVYLLFLVALVRSSPIRAADEDTAYYLRLCTADPAVVKAYTKMRTYEDPSASTEARIEAILVHSTLLYGCIERKMREKNNHLFHLPDQYKQSSSFVLMPRNLRQEVVQACNNEPLMGVLYQAMRASDTPNVPADERIRAIVTWSGAFYECITGKESEIEQSTLR